MRKSKGILSKGKPSIAVVVDGQTESWYLAMINRNEPDVKFRIKPEIPQKKSLAEQFDKVVSLAADYDEVVWIVDLDVVLKETREAKLGERKAIDVFDNMKERLESGYKNVTVIINQPCIEFWLLLHFEDTKAPFQNCDQAEERLKRHLSDYSKSQKYYTKEGNDVYLKLKELLPTALSRSQKMDFEFGNPYLGHSGMYLFFKKLGLKSDD